MMKSLFVGGLIAALAAGSAFAADMPVKAPPMVVAPTWSGTYIGINGGYAWGTSQHQGFGLDSGQFNLRGGLAGVTYGGNWQAGHVVLGFESDFDWFDAKGSIVTPVCAPAPLACFTTNKSLSTERMRAGWDWNGFLLYGTAGAAFARTRAGITTCPIPGACDERWRTGWTGGVGVETMFWRNWSAKLEWLHYDLGNAINYGPVRVLDRGDIVRLGINYHFDLLGLLHLN